MSFEEQILDSHNYPCPPWFTELWGPVGMRFRALHHLFPSLPYHAMPEAHRRLMARLPADSPYRKTVRVSLTGTLCGTLARDGNARGGRKHACPAHRQAEVDRPEAGNLATRAATKSPAGTHMQCPKGHFFGLDEPRWAQARLPTKKSTRLCFLIP